MILMLVCRCSHEKLIVKYVLKCYFKHIVIGHSTVNTPLKFKITVGNLEGKFQIFYTIDGQDWTFVNCH